MGGLALYCADDEPEPVMTRTLQTLILLALTMLAAPLSLTACGNKGPLTLPGGTADLAVSRDG
jgi:predicted small lipoprotein YifL